MLGGKKSVLDQIDVYTSECGTVIRRFANHVHALRSAQYRNDRREAQKIIESLFREVDTVETVGNALMDMAADRKNPIPDIDITALTATMPEAVTSQSVPVTTAEIPTEYPPDQTT